MEGFFIYLFILISIGHIIPGVENEPNCAVWDIHFAITTVAVVAVTVIIFVAIAFAVQ